MADAVSSLFRSQGVEEGSAGVCGVVLAGGQSRRMGRNKALLMWKGRPLLEHIAQLLHGAGCSSLVLSGEVPGYPGVADVHPLCGPLEAVCSIADVLSARSMLLVPVDMPMLKVSMLRALLEAPSRWACVHYQDHVLPMRLRLDQDTHAILAELREAEGRQRSLRQLASRLGAFTLVVDGASRSCLKNCNTPEQWAAILAGE